MSKPNLIYHDQQGLQGSFPSRQSVYPIDSAEQVKIPTAITREIQFAILPDGRIVDLVRSIREPSNLEFVVCENGNLRLSSQIELEGAVFVVPKLDPTVVSALRLPSTARTCPGIGELFMLLTNHIDRYVDITTEYNFLVAAFILTTWFADRLSVVPYLSICGPPESGKTTLVRLLDCLCRRAIHAAFITPASIYRLVTQVRPTLLIDETEFGKDLTSRDLQRLLRGGNSQGGRVLCNGKAFENFGPKVIASRIPLDDAALVRRNISIIMGPSSRDLPTLDVDAEQELAGEMQPMLEMFRLLHYERIGASQHPAFLKFPPSLRDNASALAAAMLHNDELQQRLAGALESQTYSMQFDRFGEPEWVVMLGLYRLYHLASGDCYVHTLTNEVNRMLRENGESRLYSPKMVGRILNKSLGFFTRRRGEGYYVEISMAIGRKIHSQAKAMGINRSDIEHSLSVKSGLAGHPCSLCSEFGMMVDHEGGRLSTFDELVVKLRPCPNCGVQTNREQCPGCNTLLEPDPRNPWRS